MSAKQVVYTQEARQRMLAGINALADVIKVTLGPRGRNVVLDRSYGSPAISKDGATVAREIELENQFENLGTQMLREVASKTNDLVGDGTTSAIVLAQAIYAEGARLVAAGHDPMALKRGIDEAVEHVVSALKRMARAIRDPREVAQIGTLSANGDTELGQMLAEAMEKVGPEGVITVEEGKTAETTLRLVQGMRFDRGYLSPYFVTDAERMEVVLDEPYLLISEKKISSLSELLPLLGEIAKRQKPLLIVADDLDGEALATLVVNKLRGTLNCAAVKAPSFGNHRKDILKDIAVLTGARAISDELGVRFENVTLDYLGRAARVTLDKDNTTIVGGAGEGAQIRGRVAELRLALEGAANDGDRDRFRERLAKLTGGVALLQIGAATELAIKEKKQRAEDALHATRAAVEEGIVPGGGVALLRARSVLGTHTHSGDLRLGAQIVRRALEAPLRQIAENAGLEGSLVVGRVDSGNDDFGYNAATGEYGALLDMGVLDPVKVVRVALQNAASVAGLMLTSDCLIAGQR